MCGRSHHAVLAILLTNKPHIDPLTAYGVTGPRCIDSATIIAVSSMQMNISFVVVMQTARFLFVIIAGAAHRPPVARRIKV